MKEWKGTLILMFAAFIWGNAFVAQSVGMDYLGPLFFNGIRTLLGGIVLLPVIWWMNRKSEKTTDKTYIKGGIICGIFMCAGASLQQVGLMYTSVGKAGFLTALYIVIVPIFGIFLKKKAGMQVWISVAVAAVGTYLLSITEGFSIGIGDVLMILCAIAFSVQILAVDHYAPKTDGVKLSCVQFFVAGTISTLLGLFTESPEISQVVAAWMPIAYAGILSCGVGYTLQIIGQKETPPQIASLAMSLESVFAALGGFVLLHQSLSGRELLGCALVFGAVILAQIPIGNKKKEEVCV